MATVPRPCIECGTPAAGTRCPPCEAERLAAVDAARGSPAARGYDREFRALSARARRMTPWCADAHLSPCRGVLTSDHLPGSWEKRARGERLTILDVEVVCAGHNGMRGARRGRTAR